MKTLHDNVDYYVLADQEGGEFGGGVIFEGMPELVEKFQSWAEQDNYENPKLIGWTIGQCLENWSMDLQKYTGTGWVAGTEIDFDYKITDKTNDKEKEVQRQ